MPEFHPHQGPRAGGDVGEVLRLRGDCRNSRSGVVRTNRDHRGLLRQSRLRGHGREKRADGFAGLDQWREQIRGQLQGGEELRGPLPCDGIEESRGGGIRNFGAALAGQEERDQVRHEQGHGVLDRGVRRQVQGFISPSRASGGVPPTPCTRISVRPSRFTASGTSPAESLMSLITPTQYRCRARKIQHHDLLPQGDGAGLNSILDLATADCSGGPLRGSGYIRGWLWWSVPRMRTATRIPDRAVSPATTPTAAGMPNASAMIPESSAPTAKPPSRQRR